MLPAGQHTHLAACCCGDHDGARQRRLGLSRDLARGRTAAVHHQLLALAGCCCGPAGGHQGEGQLTAAGQRFRQQTASLSRQSTPAHLCAGIESISFAVCDLLSAAAAAAADFAAAAGAPRTAPAASRGLKPWTPLYSSLICAAGQGRNRKSNCYKRKWNCYKRRRNCYNRKRTCYKMHGGAASADMHSV